MSLAGLYVIQGEEIVMTRVLMVLSKSNDLQQFAW